MTTHRLHPKSLPGKQNLEEWLAQEWLVANGLGGYASNSLGCIPTRKYHGFLIASLPVFGRTVMLEHLLEIIVFPDGREVILNNVEKPDGIIDLVGLSYLQDFYLERGLPVWIYNLDGALLEKRLFMVHAQNTTQAIYTFLNKAEGFHLKLYPFMHFRSTNVGVEPTLEASYVLQIEENRYQISRENYPSLKLFLNGEPQFTLDRQESRNVFYRKEARRGYPPTGSLWTPGFFVMPLNDQKMVTFLASTESWEEIRAMDAHMALQGEYFRKGLLLKIAPEKTKTEIGSQLVLAADQFIVSPASRIQDRVRANAAGDEVRTVIAGYHWFNDWGRDTMISLEGLTLCTGRFDEARWILRTFAYYVKNGLIPNMFPEGKKEGLYHTADATLWYFHALNSYLEATHDKDTLQFVFPKLIEIYNAHIKGTNYGIRVDKEDGLLLQGAEGYQLTWMDAKVDDWVVTPRRGKAVEINALWYNALKIFEVWLREEQRDDMAADVHALAEKVRTSFNQKFWNEKKNHLFDVIQGEKGDDDALRPNQLLAISLKYPVLEEKYWVPLFNSVKEGLLTPVGLRSLAPGHPDFKERYYGNLRERDAAYHQGTVWSWLIGPYIDVWMKIYPNEKEEAKKMLEGFYDHLTEAGIGFISEIFDAMPPYQARGCIAQAWSIAEILRSLIKVSHV